MALGQKIVISGFTESKELEGTLTAVAVYPGVHLEIAPQALTGNRPVYRYFQTPSQGKPGALIICQEDKLQGGSITTQCKASGRVFAFWPQACDQCNVMVEALTGTSPSVTVGEVFMVDSTSGKLEINSSATMVPWQSMEAYTGAAADTLTWCICIK